MAARRLSILLTVVIIAELVVIVGYVLFTRVLYTPLAFPARLSSAGSWVRCVSEMVDDANGNGIWDQGEAQIWLSEMVIQVDDPAAQDSGRFAVDECYLTPAKNDRTVHLHFLMPPGYLSEGGNDTGLMVLSVRHFVDYPPFLRLFIKRTG